MQVPNSRLIRGCHFADLKVLGQQHQRGVDCCGVETTNGGEEGGLGQDDNLGTISSVSQCSNG